MSKSAPESMENEAKIEGSDETSTRIQCGAESVGSLGAGVVVRGASARCWCGVASACDGVMRGQRHAACRRVVGAVACDGVVGNRLAVVGWGRQLVVVWRGHRLAVV